MMALEDGTGTEESDNNLLKAASYDEIPQDLTRYEIVDNIPSPLVKLELHTSNAKYMHFVLQRFEELSSFSLLFCCRNRWSCIVYRRGQKQLTEVFLKEAEHALQLALEETN